MEFITSSRVELIKTNASDIDVARAAWVSNYGEDAREKDADRIDGLIKYLYANRHMSPFEHGSFTFFVDVPLFVAREFHRHRTFSYNEVSGRYSELKPRFYIPAPERPLIQSGKVGAYNFTEGTFGQYARVKNTLERNAKAAWSNYLWLLENDIAREVARDVLPLNLMTQFYATVNPRNLMQFLDLRNDTQALYEIREVAVQMQGYFSETMPITYNAYRAGKDRANTDWQKLYEDERAKAQELIGRLNRMQDDRYDGLS